MSGLWCNLSYRFPASPQLIPIRFISDAHENQISCLSKLAHTIVSFATLDRRRPRTVARGRSYFYASLLDIAGNVFDEIVCPKRMQDIVTRNDIILKNARLLEDRISLSRRLSPRRGQSVYKKHGKNELFLGIHYLYYTKTPPCEERRFVATNSWRAKGSPCPPS